MSDIDVLKSGAVEHNGTATCEQNGSNNGNVMPCEGLASLASAIKQDRPDYKWKRSKKTAALISFSGKEYTGMQRNVGFKTIEGELLDAFRNIKDTNRNSFIHIVW